MHRKMMEFETLTSAMKTQGLHTTRFLSWRSQFSCSLRRCSNRTDRLRRLDVLSDPRRRKRQFMLSRWNWSEKETKDLSFCLQAARRSIDHPPKDETSQWYSFVGPNGVPVVVNVVRNEMGCRVAVSFPAKEDPSVSSAELCWGLYRREDGDWVRPDGSKIEEQYIKTAMSLSKTTSTYQTVVDLPLDVFPIFMGCKVEANEGQIVMHPEGRPHFTIPLGIEKGLPFPKGASLLPLIHPRREATLVNFAVVSRNATSMTLCLMNGSGKLFELDVPPEYREGDVWHIAIETDTSLQNLCFGWKANGPFGWEGGSRFHPDSISMDPYSKCVRSISTSKKNSIFLGSISNTSLPSFDWKETPRPRYGMENLVVSELDLTRSSNSGNVLQNATERITKMAETGVNAVVFRGAMLSGEDSLSGQSAPLSFFAPNVEVFVSENPHESIHQLKTLIKECHKHKLEVYLEVQFCFTAEDAQRLSLKGLDVNLYFRGKGILNCGHPVVQELILDALHHWMQEYKIDGFVFRNSETMAQDREGEIQDGPALPEAIAEDPLLRYCKLVSLSGNDELIPRQGERGFPHWGIWTEYNTRFQNDFWEFMVLSVPAKLSNIATRITGSADLFAACWDGGFPGNLAAGRRPSFGFNSPVSSFHEVVKMVQSERSQTRSLGDDDTSIDQSIVCSLLIATTVSQGVPVCPSDIWEDASLVVFLKKLLDFRKRYSDLIQPDSFEAIRGIEWHGALADTQPEWEGGLGSHFIGCSIRGENDRGFYVAFNAQTTQFEAQTPPIRPGFAWKCVAYSVLPASEKEIIVPPLSMFALAPKSAAVFEIIRDAKAVESFMPEV